MYIIYTVGNDVLSDVMLGTWFGAGCVSIRLTLGLDEFTGLFQAKLPYDCGKTSKSTTLTASV